MIDVMIGVINMLKQILPILLALLLLPSAAFATLTVTISQSGADSGSVMAGKTFTVSASGWSGCSSANIDLTGCSVCNVSESQTKSLSGSTVSWTTLTASKASSQSITVSASGSCTPDSGSVSFDVKNSPSISATPSPTSTSANAGATFSLNLDIQNTGETTARFGTITVSPGNFSISSGCSPSDISGSQTLGLSCTIAVASSAALGAQAMSILISPTNADSVTKTVTVTVSSCTESWSYGDWSACSGGTQTRTATDANSCGTTVNRSAISQSCSSGTTSSGGGGGGGSTTSSDKKTVSHKPVPPGLLNNTKLLAAIEKVLAKGKLSQTAVNNLVSLSSQISGQSDISRTINTGSARSNVTTKIKYKGAKAAKNYVVYEKIPKSFANSSDSITVSVSGAKVEVVEKDPAYAITFDTVNPNQEVSILYSVNKAVSTSTVDSFATEVYAESFAEPAAQPPAQQPSQETQPQQAPAQPSQEPPAEQPAAASEQQPSAEALPVWVIILVIIIIAAAALFYVLKKKRESMQF